MHIERLLMQLFEAALDVPWSSLHTPTPGRRRVIELNGRKMRAIWEELAPVFTCQRPASPLLFPSSRIGEKRSFDKAFDINSRPLAKDHTGEEMI